MPQLVSLNAQWGCPSSIGTPLRLRRAFTLIDVLVTLAVITVLISLLLPSLSSVRETAHQVVCRSNVRQLGFGIQLNADANKDRIPATINILTATYTPWDTNLLRFGNNRGVNSNQWDGLGLLYSQDYLPAPKLYYCPSHHGGYPIQEYLDEWSGRPGEIAGNYQYRGGVPRIGAAGHQPRSTVLLSSLSPNSALVADVLRSQADFNHQVGANVLRAGMAVSWYNDRTGTLVEALPKEGELPQSSLIELAWQQLDLP